jgi:hypothetical protein
MVFTNLLFVSDVLLLVVTAASVLVLVKKVLLAALAVFNGILALLAAIAVWKSYLVTGVKVALTAMVVIPVLGILAYFIWANRKVREAS